MVGRGRPGGPGRSAPTRATRQTRATCQTMIDFTLNEEHHLLERTNPEWGGQTITTFIRENDRKHHFDRDRILGGMAKMGLLGISVPPEYGGAGMDYISLGIASEELEYLDTSLRVIMSVHAGLNCLTLLSWGTEEQK